MEYRDFGKTGLKVSCIGFGGIAASGMMQEDANRAFASAIDRGVNYIDCAPSYGNCEEILGPALKGRRDDVILACKTGDRSKEGALSELHRSLERLQTDHFDIYQLHGVPDMDELNAALAPGGAVEGFLEAKEKGLIKHIGITVHTEDVALEAFRRFDFDSVLFPINFIYWYKGNAGSNVLEEAAKKGMGRIAMKSMALGHWPEGAERKWNKCWYQPNDNPELVDLAVRFTLSQDVNVMMPAGHLELFEMALAIGERFKPLEQDEIDRLRGIASGLTPIF